MNSEGKTQLISDQGLRTDGRKKDEMRPILLKVGVVDRADGSAYIEHGNNKIIVAVHGPREIHPKHLSISDRANVRCEYRLGTFSVKERKSPAPRRREHELSKIIAEALESAIFTEQFPRAAIDIYVQVLDADGGTRCASITAASLALADAGIPMSGLVSAVAVGKADGQIVLDLSDIEDKEGEGDLPIAINNQDGEITLLQMDGTFTVEEFEEALDMGIEACKEICEMQRKILLKKFEDIKGAVEAEEIIEEPIAEFDEIEPEGIRLEEEVEDDYNEEEAEDGFLDNQDQFDE
ncbi:MAG: exosome complex exonuclease Rrp41 [Candidatus Hodarchaeales archaeon]